MNEPKVMATTRRLGGNSIVRNGLRIDSFRRVKIKNQKVGQKFDNKEVKLAIYFHQIAFHAAASTEIPMPIFFSVAGSIAFFLPPCCTAILKDLSPPSRQREGGGKFVV